MRESSLQGSGERPPQVAQQSDPAQVLTVCFLSIIPHISLMRIWKYG